MDLYPFPKKEDQSKRRFLHSTSPVEEVLGCSHQNQSGLLYVRVLLLTLLIFVQVAVIPVTFVSVLQIRLDRVFNSIMHINTIRGQTVFDML